MTRTVLADDHPFLRTGVEAVLRNAGIEVAASVGDGPGALEAIRAVNPDVVILDVNMPGMDGVEVLNAMRQEGDGRPVVLLTAQIDDARLVAAVRANVNGIILKQGAEQGLVDTIRTVASGGRDIPQELMERAMNAAIAARTPDPFASLAPREFQIAEGVARGMRNREIAALVGMTEGSVKVYLNRIFDKIGVENRTDLAIRFHRVQRVS